MVAKHHAIQPQVPEGDRAARAHAALMDWVWQYFAARDVGTPSDEAQRPRSWMEVGGQAVTLTGAPANHHQSLCVGCGCVQSLQMSMQAFDHVADGET